MIVEDIKEMIDTWDKTRKINCSKLMKLSTEYLGEICVVCCQCQSDVQRKVDRLRKALNGYDKG